MFQNVHGECGHCFTTPLHKVVYVKSSSRNTFFKKSIGKTFFADIAFVIIKEMAKSNVRLSLRTIKNNQESKKFPGKEYSLHSSGMYACFH